MTLSGTGGAFSALSVPDLPVTSLGADATSAICLRCLAKIKVFCYPNINWYFFPQCAFYKANRFDCANQPLNTPFSGVLEMA